MELSQIGSVKATLNLDKKNFQVKSPSGGSSRWAGLKLGIQV